MPNSTIKIKENKLNIIDREFFICGGYRPIISKPKDLKWFLFRKIFQYFVN